MLGIISTIVKRSMISKSKIRAIDAHAHYPSKDEGLHRIALAGVTHQNSLELLNSFSNRENVFIGYGLHPWFIKQHQSEKEKLTGMIDFIGEIDGSWKRGVSFPNSALFLNRCWMLQYSKVCICCTFLWSHISIFTR